MMLIVDTLRLAEIQMKKKVEEESKNPSALSSRIFDTILLVFVFKSSTLFVR